METSPINVKFILEISEFLRAYIIQIVFYA